MKNNSHHNGSSRGEILDAMPPAAVDSEIALLGGVLHQCSIPNDITLRPHEFYTIKHQVLWRIVDHLHAEYGRIDIGMVAGAINSDSRCIAEGVDRPFLGELAAVGGTVHFAYHAGEIRKAHQRRAAFNYARQILGKAANNCEIDELRDKAAEIVRFFDEEKEIKQERFSLVTSSALASADYTASPIINECLYAGHPAFIGGMFKTCKTLVAIDAAISIGSGMPFLGSFTIAKPEPVVYFSGEGGGSMIQEYGHRIAASKGVQLADASNVYWCFSVPKLESDEDLDAMVDVIKETSAKVIFIDNTTLAMSGDDAGVVMKMGRLFGLVIERCAALGCTPVFIHHFKRTRTTDSMFDPGELIDLTQAGAAEIAGQWMLLTRRERYDADQPGEHRLWLNIGGRLGHGCLHALDVHEGRMSDPGGRKWEVEVVVPSEARKDAATRQAEDKKRRSDERKDAELESNRSELVKVITRHKSPMTERDFRSHVTFQGTPLKRAIVSLVEEGVFVPCDFNKSNKQTYSGWRLMEALDTTG